MSFRRSRLFSRASRASSRSRASRVGFLPRFFAAKASSAPRARCLRHVVRCKEYSPSRRKSAPICPEPAQASASRRIRAFYSAENRRRRALATTSTVAAAPVAAPSVALRAPFWAATGAPIPFVSNLSMLREPPRPYSNLDQAGVSRFIGTGGRPRYDPLGVQFDEATMDVMIFNPPRYHSGRYHKFNNALLWLASYLHHRGATVRIVPLNNGRYEETVLTELEEHRPSIVAISCKWWDTLYSSIHIASLVKHRDPGITTVAGGHTASFFARDLAGRGYFDVVVRGDGEKPLLGLVEGKRPENCVFADDGDTSEASFGYVQTEETLGDIWLVENIAGLVSDASVLNSYVWTGKGCLERCLYCAGNSWNTARCFGRTGIAYRPLETVIRDIEILSRVPGGKRLTFDFEPLRGSAQESYYMDLFSGFSDKERTCYFCSWSLPSKALVDVLSRTFHFVELCIDVQTGSESLRRRLAERRFLKPYVSDSEIEELLSHVEAYPNVMVDISTLMGLPHERDEDVQTIQAFADRIYDRFEFLRYPYVSPMNVEPGSLPLKNPGAYDMVLFRKSFDDFLRYTRRSFEQNINCYQPESYDDGAFHPLGVASRDDVARGDVLRVYESWKKIQHHVDRRSAERMLARMCKYREYGLEQFGIRGRIDRGSPSRSEVESIAPALDRSSLCVDEEAGAAAHSGILSDPVRRQDPFGTRRSITGGWERRDKPAWRSGWKSPSIQAESHTGWRAIASSRLTPRGRRPCACAEPPCARTGRSTTPCTRVRRERGRVARGSECRRAFGTSSPWTARATCSLRPARRGSSSVKARP